MNFSFQDNSFEINVAVAVDTIFRDHIKVNSSSFDRSQIHFNCLVWALMVNVVSYTLLALF